MGDRGNIKIGKVFLYTHWGGSDIKKDLKKALEKHERWDDEPYITRIIFDVLSEGKQGDSTGFGISTEICDNDNYILEVDVDNQEIIEWETDDLTVEKERWTFEKFISEEK